MKRIKKVLGCLRKADQDYDLIKDGDVIAVGLSGGKDSSVLLYCLYLYQMFSRKDYRIIGLHLDMGFGEDNYDLLKEFFDQYGIETLRHPTQINEILKLNSDDAGRISCSLCSTLRKGAVINKAKELGCNKIAFGHHSDDAVETLFMNMIHGGRVATFKPKIYLERSEVEFIRPLIYAYETDIIKVAEDLDIPIVKNNCPNDGYSERAEIKAMLKEMYHKYPGAKDNFQLMLRNHDKIELFDPIKHD